MNLKEVQKEIIACKESLAKVPAIERRLHHLFGMEEVLTSQEEEKNKPELKVPNK